MIECRYCRFWSADSAVRGMGECRFSAPVLPDLEKEGMAAWPRTESDDWCADAEEVA